MKKKEIHFSVALDENQVPEAISWQATDAGPSVHFAKAINISVWDRSEAGTMKIDLWTKDMPVEEMKYFSIDMLGAMAETVMTATGDKVMSDKIIALCKDLMAHVETQQQNNTKQ
ncbi:MAG: gliding motility protein GldC [Hymenobacteraceae bacterium]|nr:gliding motility protein GldC [Hymenobacteraceae bacterium]MDX5397684.1 gliding motility protein GldC [Hymenobacteraceae bacterium]MDX5444056.1 gliding motility protein GldC [Hymenobacteraceae bacterium]MDX5513762.1 gliding motility protein GldC [Hymenobacteraceae bacterium]